ncbi:unnamed protein product [Angiostrongylus costaricensis]|uniref:N-acetyltransferase domain-containing protein n=1 Tax=Angiostrongylus costaricensis TaxID=334426 RepID=A0A158PGY8_ANGCS|nr:unnamed protein product [Angiostrongylus costaricensis]
MNRCFGQTRAVENAEAADLAIIAFSEEQLFSGVTNEVKWVESSRLLQFDDIIHRNRICVISSMICRIQDTLMKNTLLLFIKAIEISKGPYKQHKANQLTAYVNALEQGIHRLPGHFTKCLKIDIICVADEAKGHGLGKELTKRAINVARSEGCEWVVTAATAAASQAVFTRMGFETFYEIPFSNFCENGTVVFNNLFDGCSSGKLMALRLNK